jgi:hypothetical protein
LPRRLRRTGILEYSRQPLMKLQELARAGVKLAPPLDAFLLTGNPFWSPSLSREFPATGTAVGTSKP